MEGALIMTRFWEELIFQNSKKFYAPHSTSKNVEKIAFYCLNFYKLAIFLLNLLSTQLFLIFVHAVCVSETVYLLVASVMVKH